MRAPPMRQPTAAPAIAPVLDGGPGVCVEVALVAELETVEDVEVACEDVEVCKVPRELDEGSGGELVIVMKVVFWGGSWI